MSKVIIYCDGVFDLFHMGHRRLFKYLKSLHKESTLIVGIVGDIDATEYKRKPIFTENLRYNLINNTGYVDKIIMPCPMSTSREFINENGITHIYHAFADENDIEKQKAYFKIPIEMGIFRQIPYNAGISTTEIIDSIKKCKPNWDIENLTVTQIEQGLTNTNFRVLYKGESIFLRLYTDITPKEDIKILSLLNEHGFGAKILSTFEGGRIEEWIEGRVMQREELTIENIKKLAQIMKKFHNLGICHNDLNLTNIIVESSGNLCIIDWEYCVQNGDILFDIANFFLEWMYDYTANDWYKPRKELFPSRQEMDIFCQEYGVNCEDILSKIPEVNNFWINWMKETNLEKYLLFKKYRLEINVNTY